MTKNDLINHCKTLFGKSWVSTTAERCGVDDKTVYRWHTGVHQIPKDMKETLRQFYDDRIKELRAGRKSLK